MEINSSNKPRAMFETDAATVTSQLNGRLIRVVNVSDLKGYISYRSSDTGHIVYTVRGVDGPVEYHILIIGGKPVAASSEKSRLYGSELIDSLNGVAGTAEYYFIEEEIIRSVLDKYPRIAINEGKTKGWTGDSAMSEIVNLHDSVGEDWYVRALEPDTQQHTPALAPDVKPDVKPASMGPEDTAMVEDDIRYMKNLQEEFESDIDSLLTRLKLTHLKMSHDKKKS